MRKRIAAALLVATMTFSSSCFLPQNAPQPTTTVNYHEYVDVGKYIGEIENQDYSFVKMNYDLEEKLIIFEVVEDGYYDYVLRKAKTNSPDYRDLAEAFADLSTLLPRSLDEYVLVMRDWRTEKIIFTAQNGKILQDILD